MKYKTVRIPVMEKDERELEWVYFIISDEILSPEDSPVIINIFFDNL